MMETFLFQYFRSLGYSQRYLTYSYVNDPLLKAVHLKKFSIIAPCLKAFSINVILSLNSQGL